MTNASLISCNFSTFPSCPIKDPKFKTLRQTHSLNPRLLHSKISSRFSNLIGRNSDRTAISFQKKGLLQICKSTLKSQNPEDPVLSDEGGLESELGNSGNVSEGRNWTTSILLFVLWGALMYYVFNLAPNQTPENKLLNVVDDGIREFISSRDMYFLKKLLNLKGDDGFRMNEVLVSLWYIMGLWPLTYSMLLLPTGRSSKSNIPVWPFLTLSFGAGVYGLLPYFVLWKPPPPPVEETELSRWPLNFLESKLTAGISLAAGLGLIIYAGLANADVWKEFYQYFRESRFIHVMSLDFILMSAFAPFWVYNDMTSRKMFDKGSWLLPLSLVPFLGPALYVVIRPPLSAMPVSSSEPK